MRKYTPIYRWPRGRLYICSQCSAVVKDTEQHQNWHEVIVDCFKVVGNLS